ncbi:NCS2 family permease [Acetobacter orientalis]|uniref:NCS2 family permease n=1 Tax=Acetobacter orientalis TaxID=146474 RepID=UPI00209D85C9|nr:NCS2 family permease [Acetobacter orientalis]MCP1216552.1 NCS2 family permease [Acetobacter orientalis]MCP1219692.1 NCS2 family permease [Acetobacter orientalis]
MPGLPARIGQVFDRYFQVSARGSSFGREIVAGITTFGAMAYIMAVNPDILLAAGLDKNAMVMTTIAAAVCGSLLMALWANLPIALAPAMSSNVIFAQVVVVRMGVPPGVAFTMVLLGGAAFLLLSLTQWRQKIITAFPVPVRLGIHFAIGAFIAHVGMITGGLAVKSKSGLAFGALTDPAVLLTIAGLFLAIILRWSRVPAAMLIAIGAVTVAGCFIPHANGQLVTALPSHWAELPHYPWYMLFPYDFKGFFAQFFMVLPVTLYFFLGDFFDATGTMMAVTQRSGLKDKQGQPLLGRAAFASDATASVVGSALGTSTVSAYLESLVGVEEGGRTGIVGLTVAVLFALSSFFWPLITAVPAVATAPVLILVGLGMLGGLTDLADMPAQDKAVPLLMVLVTVMTGDFMISLALGLLLYTLLLVVRREWSRLSVMLLGLDAVFVVYLFIAARMV